jgi:hypothetical protein
MGVTQRCRGAEEQRRKGAGVNKIVSSKQQAVGRKTKETKKTK